MLRGINYLIIAKYSYYKQFKSSAEYTMRKCKTNEKNKNLVAKPFARNLPPFQNN
jgi:hypothetical protein